MNADIGLENSLLEPLHESSEQVKLRFSNLLNSIDEAVVLTDADGIIVEISDKLTQLLKYSLKDLCGESLQMLSASLHNKRFFQNSWLNIKEAQHTRIELWNQCKLGTLIPVEQTSMRLAGEIEGQHFFLHILKDLSTDISLSNNLQKLSMYDSLTGLPNRSSILQNLRNEVSRLASSEQRCAVIFIDLDGFKKINDVYDHQTGDKLLIAGVNRILQVVDAKMLGRLGGDELILIHPFVDQQSLDELIDDVLNCFIEPFAIDGHDLFLGINIGVSIAPDNSSNPEELINQADMALHTIKNTEQRLQYYTSEFSQKMQRQLKIEHNLKQAIEKDQLDVLFQPKYDLTSNEVVGMEALLRWQHEELGQVPPDEFIGIAESAGLIVSIGRYVLDVSCRLINRIKQSNGQAVPIAVNISGYHFSQSDVYMDVQEVLEKYQIPPQLLEVEVTENVLMMDYNNVIEQLTGLKELGVQISIDDFGTGHSSLERLANLPIDTLKIDRSFVLELNDQPNKQAIIKAVLSLTHSLGLKSIAEGIESETQEHFLRANNCHFGQGFHFARPISDEEIIRLLTQ